VWLDYRLAMDERKRYEQPISIRQPQDVSGRRQWQRWMDPALSGKEWIRIFLKRMGDKLPKTITAAAKLLAEESKLAVGTCKNLLRNNTDIWEKKPRGRPNPPRPRSK
jgi:hypothetical protein